MNSMRSVSYTHLDVYKRQNVFSKLRDTHKNRVPGRTMHADTMKE